MWKFILLVLLAAAVCQADLQERVCIGTNGRMSVPSNRDTHYRNLRDRFTNCTYVDGNLELTWIQNDTMDLSFLKYIREVTGYVLISHVNVRQIILPQLQIIRGRTLFKLNVREEEFGLLVTMSSAFTLELPALRDVLRGSVGIYNNFNLCHVKTINWDEIITGVNATYVYVYNFTSPERDCPRCHESCEAGCWGDGPENCQKFSKTNCSPQCAQGRCFGPNPRDCCNTFCAGGCTGPLPSQCLACRNFYDEGTCSQECPPMQIYNPTNYSWEPNPNGKYAYGATCVRNCPEHLLKDNGACVRSCPPNKTAVNGECIPCNVTCPKTCRAERPIHSGNIESFRDCTIIDGSIEILEMTFTGFQHVNPDYSFGERYPKMEPDALEVFSTVREVTGYLNVQALHSNFTSLSYFRNLEVIGGRQVVENLFASLYIVKTSLRSLGLKSLKRVNSGAIAIMENKNLCFADKIAWNKLVKSKDHKQIIQKNADQRTCEKNFLVCDPQCSADGCWGPGPDQCLSCQNFKVGETCIQNCSVQPGLYKAGPKSCRECHSECLDGCTGPSRGNCTRCKHVRDGPYCVVQCPEARYPSENGTCESCHYNCFNGCTGPANTVGEGGCNFCKKAIISIEATVESCLAENEPCPDGYYNEWVGNVKPLEGKVKVVCRKCHPLCKKCTGFGIHEQVCRVCNGFKRGDQCEDECPTDHFTDEEFKTCTPCHHECRGCTGPSSTNCIRCQNLKVYLTDTNTYDNTSAFNCTDTCPENIPHKIYFDELLQNPIDEPYCSASANTGLPNMNTAKTPTILIIILILAFLFLIILGIIGYTCRQKAKAKKEAVKMTRVLTGCEDNEPLRPTNVKPNLAKLRIVKEVELRRGGMLGFGAFGKVYKGVWVPEGENVKIPVAIKVLKEGTGANTSKEFLEEAYIMASVEHPNLLQLLAVCMTNQMMLITQLMPLGCLLDYVRIHKEKIGSKAFLNWCTQIARGMSYLEEKRLVHRDLAARNVLVQTPNCVKITDFGLAKLLDINEDEYKAAGGKMPIKWLALECIQHRIFTHKSDVWAFGVTIWEILSYGARPYENISARNVPELIENGLKLPQPNICTLDIYCIMVSCWMLDADSRPTFKQLADTFAEMARDPGRYLVIPGDKFMRLPSYSTQDEKEMIRNLSSAMEGPESLVEADEYLQPKFKTIPGTATTSMVSAGIETQTSSLKPCTSSSWANNVTGTECITSDGSNKPEGWDHELLRYNHQTNPDGSELRHYYNNGVCASDTSSSRYCSDPMKSRTECTLEGNFDSMSKTKEAQVGNLKLNLPLDEDDYLMPSPQHNQNASTYMDLIGEGGEGQDVKELRYSSFVGPKRCVDNPEYLMSDESIPPQTLGIPTEPVQLESLCVSEGSGSESTPRPGTSKYLPQRSVEEESMSDHEYYNDLQRELQPLRRNETTVLYKAGPKSCRECHSECLDGCTGPSRGNCTRCKHVRDGPYCVVQCPEARYPSENGTCESCHYNCFNGCTGPANTVGEGGCNFCKKAIISIEATVESCLAENEPCPDGYYNEWVGNVKPLEGKVKVVCRKCHPLCKKCTGFGIHEQVCRVCNGFKRGDQCEDECPTDHFTDEEFKTCTPCHHECRGCTGPSSTNCIRCQNLKVYLTDTNTYDNTSAFNCTDTCPENIPHKIYFDELLQNPIDEPYCSASANTGLPNMNTAKTPTILIIILILAFLFLIILGIIGYTCRQKAKAKKEAVKMTRVLTGCEDNEPLRPTNVKPNLAKLRIVKEVELRRGGMLGFGAFGKVYKGVWVPEGENVKIPVAIKVLKEGTGANTSKEFLEEAYIMASVEHPNLLQLLAVCMTNQMMLITQLMPLGCLLDYVRIHKEKIGSKAFLNWCTQIARGMSYLEEKRLVHRDLAARNVLVQTPNCVKITDFGLAKLLDINEDEYKAAGGKMPIKWLALECIQHRIFTHKSDVWAFGVTIWEILSYGARPYENISARNVPELIENGLKLPQPNICTLDIYCIMVSCWMLDADSRPTFKQLADTFAEMARDPGRYLVIPGDKFMRLPSYSTQDEKEMIRNLSSAMEGPESLVEADEYLQPKFKTIPGTATTSMVSAGIETQTSSLKPCTSSSWANNVTGTECITSDGSNKPEGWDHELLRYNHQTNPDGSELRHYYNNGVCASDTSSSRYCSDPMKSRTECTLEGNFDSMSKTKEAQVGNLKLNLPLDEDDYLMPSPQHNQNASTYMDLIGEGGEGQDVKELRYSSFVGPKRCVDNPEYLMSDESIPPQTLGIPTEPVQLESLCVSEGSGSESTPRPGTSKYLPQRSVEEESMSDHEYYNDLQRELQPLRRNETTV